MSRASGIVIRSAGALFATSSANGDRLSLPAPTPELARVYAQISRNIVESSASEVEGMDATVR
jgi:hypothetical protein